MCIIPEKRKVHVVDGIGPDRDAVPRRENTQLDLLGYDLLVDGLPGGGDGHQGVFGLEVY